MFLFPIMSSVLVFIYQKLYSHCVFNVVTVISCNIYAYICKQMNIISNAFEQCIIISKTPATEVRKEIRFELYTEAQNVYQPIATLCAFQLNARRQLYLHTGLCEA